MNHWRLQCLSLFSWIKKHFGNTKHITHAQISLLVSMWLLTLWCLLHSSKSLSSPFFTPWVFWTPGVREFNSLQRRRPPNVQTPEPRACECVPGYCYCLVLSFEYLVVRVVSCLIAKRMKMWMLHSPFSFSPLPLLQLLTIHPWLLFKRAFIHPSIHPSITQREMRARGCFAFVRVTHGDGDFAACGQLATTARLQWSVAHDARIV